MLIFLLFEARLCLHLVSPLTAFVVFESVKAVVYTEILALVNGSELFLLISQNLE